MVGTERPGVVAVMVPKAGTHLLDSILARMPGFSRLNRASLNTNLRYHPFNLFPGERCVVGVGRPVRVSVWSLKSALTRVRPGKYALAYIPYQKRVADVVESKRLKMIVLLRDPRAICLSALHHAMDHPEHFLYRKIRAIESPVERVRYILSGPTGSRREIRTAFAEQISGVAEWAADSRVLAVRFEDLVGPFGGGDPGKQLKSIQAVARHLEVLISESEAQAVGRDMYGTGKTFRQGRIDGWRDADPKIIETMEQELGPILDRLGYERESRP